MTELLNRSGANHQIHEEADFCVLRLEGEFAGFPPQRLQSLETRIVGQNCHSVVIDASLLTNVDDIGLAQLSNLEAAARANGTHFAIYAATGTVGTTLDDAGLG